MGLDESSASRGPRAYRERTRTLFGSMRARPSVVATSAGSVTGTSTVTPGAGALGTMASTVQGSVMRATSG
jgi:ammonia channel protein AmtB